MESIPRSASISIESSNISAGYPVFSEITDKRAFAGSDVLVLFEFKLESPEFSITGADFSVEMAFPDGSKV
jgi:hypothetical protein